MRNGRSRFLTMFGARHTSGRSRIMRNKVLPGILALSFSRSGLPCPRAPSRSDRGTPRTPFGEQRIGLETGPSVIAGRRRERCERLPGLRLEHPHHRPGDRPQDRCGQRHAHRRVHSQHHYGTRHLHHLRCLPVVRRCRRWHWAVPAASTLPLTLRCRPHDGHPGPGVLRRGDGRNRRHPQSVRRELRCP